jgi:hypothetical protein
MKKYIYATIAFMGMAVPLAALANPIVVGLPTPNVYSLSSSLLLIIIGIITETIVWLFFLKKWQKPKKLLLAVILANIISLFFVYLMVAWLKIGNRFSGAIIPFLLFLLETSAFIIESVIIYKAAKRELKFGKVVLAVFVANCLSFIFGFVLAAVMFFLTIHGPK